MYHLKEVILSVSRCGSKTKNVTHISFLTRDTKICLILNFSFFQNKILNSIIIRYSYVATHHCFTIQCPTHISSPVHISHHQCPIFSPALHFTCLYGMVIFILVLSSFLSGPFLSLPSVFFSKSSFFPSFRLYDL